MSNFKQSVKDTVDHILCVVKYIQEITEVLSQRAIIHDNSKLKSPEIETFNKVTPKLKTLKFGSDEYKDALKEMGPALEHHYKNNRHHPEYFENGIKDMNLIDIIEMLVDWKASTLRVKDGNLRESIEHNSERFNISNDLKQILLNTVDYLNW